MVWDRLVADVVDEEAVLEDGPLEGAVRRGRQRAPIPRTSRRGGPAGGGGSGCAAAPQRRLEAVARGAVNLAGEVVVAAHDEIIRRLGCVLGAHRAQTRRGDLGAELRSQRLSGGHYRGGLALVEEVMTGVVCGWPARSRAEGQAEWAVRAERDRLVGGPFDARGDQCPVPGYEQGVVNVV